MKKGKVIALLAALLCIVIGAALIFAVLQKNDFDWNKLNTVQTSEKTVTVDEPFTSVSADCAFADLTILPDPSGETLCRAECVEYEGIRFDVQAADGVLTVTCVDERTASQRIGVFSVTPKVVLHLKNAQFDALTVNSGSGDLKAVDGLLFRKVSVTMGSGDVGIVSDTEAVTVKTGSGDVSMNGGTPRTVTLTTGSGTMQMHDVKAIESIRVQTGSGDISLRGCDAPTLDLRTQSGDVTGTLATGKVYDVQTSSGAVRVPPDGDGGTCTVRTSSGDVRFQ